MNEEHDENLEYDGNVLQISFDPKQGWKGQLNFLTGNLLGQTKNFIISLFPSNNIYSKVRRRKSWMKNFYESSLPSIASDNAFYQYWIVLKQFLNQYGLLKSIAFLGCLIGYFLFYYYYLKTREKRLDFVDLAMKDKLFLTK